MLIGTSGSGKSTTLKMINQLVEHDSGVIRFAGEDIRRQPLLALRRRMGYAIQSIGLFHTGQWRKISPPCRSCKSGRAQNYRAG